jgi:hypothetical protein
MSTVRARLRPPTYRLRDVCETVATYDESFWNSGHSPRIIVFDDSSVANHEKYYPLLEKTRTSLVPPPGANPGLQSAGWDRCRMRRHHRGGPRKPPRCMRTPLA